MGKDLPELEGTRPSPAFPFASRYTVIEGRRIHYVEEGKGLPILFIHGNPTSSYLWRNILPHVAAESGRRGIALDLLGFGRSDKPEDIEYTLRMHAEIVEQFIDKLGLHDLVLVLHDWGGPLGMHYAVRHPENIHAVALMETFLWDMAWKDFGRLAPVFRVMRSPAGYVLLQRMNLFVERILPRSVIRRDHITPEVMKHYREPFPTIGSRRAIRDFPRLLPVGGRPEDSCRFMEDISAGLPHLTCPVLWIKAEPGAIITKNTEYRLTALSALVPQLSVVNFGPGLHYLQEDDPNRLASLITGWMKSHDMHSLPWRKDRSLNDAA
jgi:haloalkane dehalogenase